MRVLSVVGARPQFVKLAPIAEALRNAEHEHHIVHTGQHYDERLSDAFFADLEIPRPDATLGVGSGSHAVQTGRMLEALEPVLEEYAPDWVIVYGDTNSTLAGALTAAKLHLPLAHLEAGLRSFNRRMPEELNRVLTDHAADLLLAPTERSIGHLQEEGLAARSRLVGDVMADVCLRVKRSVEGRPPPEELPDDFRQSRRGFVVATIHRPENTDDPRRLARIIRALSRFALPVVLPAHPRLVARARDYSLSLQGGSTVVTRPLRYPDLVSTVLHSRGVITDSGGLQKEAFLLQRPCLTLRSETEWVETVDLGGNRLVPEPEDLAAAWDAPAPVAEYSAAPFGSGHAAEDAILMIASER